MIELESVTKIIKGKTVLNNISYTFHDGRTYGIKGVNGSGKTMMLRIIAGLIYPTTGNVKIDGRILGKDISFPDRLGVIIENPSFLNTSTGFGNLQLLTSLNGYADEFAIKRSLKRVGLDPEDKRKYKKYSLGMKQRLGIAAAIMEEPKIILFDEPLNALDKSGIRMFDSIIAEEKNREPLIIMTCHEEEKLRAYSDIILCMENGMLSEEEEGKWL